MTADEFRQGLAALYLSQVAYSKLIGVNDRTMRRWAKEGPPRAAAVTLALALEVARLGGAMAARRVMAGVISSPASA